jgi:hypothetical protein
LRVYRPADGAEQRLRRCHLLRGRRPLSCLPRPTA